MGKFLCGECGNSIKKGEKFCKNCGAELVRENEKTSDKPKKVTSKKEIENFQCGECGHTVKKGAKICQNCGSELVRNNEGTKEKVKKKSPKKESEVFQCGECGYTVKKGANNCKNCGAELAWETEEEEKKSSGNLKNTIDAENKKTRGKISNHFHIWNLRVGRNNYLIQSIKSIVIRGIIYLIIHKIDISLLTIFYFIAFFLFCFIDYIHATIGRIHDIGKNGWRILLGLIPGLNVILWILLFFIKGEKGDNRFGEDENKLLIRFLGLDILKLLTLEANRIANDQKTYDNISGEDLFKMLYDGSKRVYSKEEKEEALLNSCLMSSIYKELYQNRFERKQYYQGLLEKTINSYYPRYCNEKISQKMNLLENLKEKTL